MKILFHSNAPWTPTGYGQQAAVWAPRLKSLGHDIVISSFYGLHGTQIEWHGIKVLPGSNGDSYGSDVLPARVRSEKADLLLTLMDIWVLQAQALTACKTACWVPVDTQPLGVRDVKILQDTGAIPIAFSRHGEKQLKEAGFKPLYVPHGIDTAHYKPSPRRDEIRRNIGLDDKFIIGMNAALKDTFRKGIYEQLAAFRILHDRHPDTALMFHGLAQEQSGLNLPLMVQRMDLRGAVHYADQDAVMSGEMSNSEEYLPTWYSVLDLYTACSFGEGFGLTIAEAEACGTPAVVTNFSAMPEVGGQGCWKVNGEYVWNPVHNSLWMKPSVKEIARAYEAAYARGKAYEQRKAKARESALRYDADTVLTQYWKPVLEEIEQSSLID